VPDFSDPQTLNRYSYCINNPIIYTDPNGQFFIEILIGAVIGSAIGAGVSAATGGDIAMGALTGAIGGAIFGGVGGYIQGAAEAGQALSSVTQAGLHAVAGATSGGINSAITGGNIGQGMLIGGISAGIGKYAGGLLPKGYGYQLAGRAVIGGVTGGMTSELYGGDFGQGFVLGGSTAAIGTMANGWLHEEFLPWLKNTFSGKTLYGGAEVHTLLGVGIETYATSDGDIIKTQTYLKVCLGDAIGAGAGGGFVLNPPKQFWDAYEGASIETGRGIVETAVNFSSDMPVSYGINVYGVGVKYTPCWYFSIGKWNY